MRRAAPGGVAVAALAATVALLAWSARGLAIQTRSSGPDSFDALLGLVAAGCAAACGTWLAAAAVLTIVGSLPGALARSVDDLARMIMPAVWRRAIHVALGAALVAGPVTGSAAWADERIGAQAVAAEQFDQPSGLPPIDRPALDPAALPPIDRPTDPLPGATWTPTAPPPAVPVATPASPLLTGNPRPTATVEEAIVVRRGDTLWHIAARHLGSTVTPAEVATEWPRWWHANRDVIGDDPDLILPGQILRPPS
jgi:resuscitation-promoting factor RpfA